MDVQHLIGYIGLAGGAIALARLAVTYPRRATPTPIPAGPIVVGYTQDALQARIHRNDREEAQR
jgi:hypothetical protein